ncbi:DUF1214 domain-containing protein [Achromobacter spanius]|uniref:DUF1214 domain-containing protein n=1 Tax=Achromobacter spanius TaxID=217203 RepID=UPI0018F886D2|nr:DUF1214 domain-containing protein [Achromobacter spanius]
MSAPQAVNVHNFVRAETDMYIKRGVESADGLGKLTHVRTPASIDKQDVVRMNRDTLYSMGVFDLQASPLVIEMPDAAKRFMSLQVISQDHYVPEVVYGPGRFEYTQANVGTRYAYVIVRTFADPNNAADVALANQAQDAIKMTQTSMGKLELPEWDPVTQTKARDALETLGSLGNTPRMFGNQADVDPIDHLIGAAVGWGGNPPSAAVYVGNSPAKNDGKTPYALTVKDVPVDGFWSISVYDGKGFFAKNDQNAYSLNNVTATPAGDGSYTIYFGDCGQHSNNCLPIVPGWNYTVRLYKPQKPILDGSWKFPDAKPVN